MNVQTKYYRIQAEGYGAYGFRHAGAILAVRGDREWLLTDAWCGSGVEGLCYRQYVAGRRRPWPKAADRAEEKNQMAALRLGDGLCTGDENERLQTSTNKRRSVGGDSRMAS